MESANITITTKRAAIAIALSVIGIAGSVKLKSCGEISELSLLALISLSVFVGLVIAFIDRIKSFTITLQKFTVTLREMKETEASVKQVARAILGVIESQSHGIMLESYDGEKADTAIE